jgi:hypothetical protein
MNTIILTIYGGGGKISLPAVGRSEEFTPLEICRFV